jgi:succinate dehydrogenase/fumarate reductase flavoprotein subunit
MGGIQIDEASRVMAPSGPVTGLYACGEMAGGVHGANRLGGSSLLGCVVYGRVAGNTAATYLLSQLTAQRRLGAVAGHVGGGAPITISVGGVNVSITYGNAPAPSLGPATVAQEAEVEEPKAGPVKQGVYSLADVAKHNKEDDCWVVVDGRVLDCTNFLADHPGGKKVF